MTLIAHAAHWFSAAAYVLPVVALVTWLVVVQVRERSRARQRGSDGAMIR